MMEEILINDYPIQAEKVHIDSDGVEQDKKKISLTFKVTHEDYHGITTLLYKNDFIVQVPSRQLSFPAVIHTYSTSLDNLYEEGAVGIFYVQLVEKVL